ncbi:hypothetical protein C8R44DRAFT_805776 [Mycena epipterygia]|nr:hypothetical protein C8R44DRAFT_805776 [Mycena epipterygia]
MAVGGYRAGVVCVSPAVVWCVAAISASEGFWCGGVGRTLLFSSPAGVCGTRVWARAILRGPLMRSRDFCLAAIRGRRLIHLGRQMRGVEHPLSFPPPTSRYALPSLTVTLVLFLPSSFVAISLPCLTPHPRFSLPAVIFLISFPFPNAN